MRNKAAQPAGYADGAAGRPAGGSHTAPADVHNITDARTAHSDDMRQRMFRYAVAMGIRLVCLFLIFILPGWFKIIAVVGAVALPWFAVIIANGGSDTLNEHAVSLLDQAPLAELEAPAQQDQTGGPSTPGDGDSPLLQGEVIPPAPPEPEAPNGTPEDGGHRP
ncbi:DUF3099 domain-containing protein [Arthrobacter sp. A5]|uniref:DUF3099 domain-containing protein n=1 Tax=Arthrobacter sp. A5 TaxID=576926 RepID=UPI003DAA2843